jgi:DNA repair exonuclease SbcCD ATPase subunit
LKEDQQKVIQNLVSEKETISEWMIRFKGFKSFLANKKLKIIQNMINKYLKDMKCSDQLKLEGYRMVGKETREKITPSIYRDGELRSFGSFSKGERVRIDMATLMTLQTLVNESSKTGGLGILFADEIGEGLDSMGVGLLLESLNLTGKTTMYTTHVVDDKIYDNILMIEKRNNISQIKRN